jgi:hypothetical protein
MRHDSQLAAGGWTHSFESRLTLDVQLVLKLDDPTDPDHWNSLLGKENGMREAGDVISRVAALMTGAAVRDDQALVVVATDDLDVNAEQIGHHADGEQGVRRVIEHLLPGPIHEN